VRITPELAAALSLAERQWSAERRTAVDLEVDPASRTCAVRECLLSLAFETDGNAAQAADGLAVRLADAMDRRSAPCLFMGTVSGESNDRTVALWTFPRDEAFQFATSGGIASVSLLDDVFSQTSGFRKAALFRGSNIRTDFITGRVLDLQISSRRGEAAQYWIRGFLGARLAISGESGTRVLAATLRSTWEATTDATERDQLFAALTAVRDRPACSGHYGTLRTNTCRGPSHSDS
jgi:hypothetical protein